MVEFLSFRQECASVQAGSRSRNARFPENSNCSFCVEKKNQFAANCANMSFAQLTHLLFIVLNHCDAVVTMLLAYSFLLFSYSAYVVFQSILSTFNISLRLLRCSRDTITGNVCDLDFFFCTCKKFVLSQDHVDTHPVFLFGACISTVFDFIFIFLTIFLVSPLELQCSYCLYCGSSRVNFLCVIEFPFSPSPF